MQQRSANDKSKGNLRLEGALRTFPLHSAPCSQCPVRRTGFCGRLKDADHLEMSNRKRLIAFPANRSLAQSGVLGPFSILVSGYIRTTHHRADGRRQVVGLTSPGELIEAAQRRENIDLEAATDIRVCQIHPASRSNVLSSSHEFRQAIFKERQIKVEWLRDQVWTIGAQQPAERVAGFLLSCRNFMPWQPLPFGGGVLTMELQRSDIAAFLDTTVETLCRVIRKLHSDGLIRAHDARHLEIPDLSRLAEFAGVTPQMNDQTGNSRRFPI
ncbi:Crp/Fnr family transcriptional regulator [Roseinatronobacter sp.]